MGGRYGGVSDHWHQGAGFVTSHVALTLEYERSLQAIYPCEGEVTGRGLCRGGREGSGGGGARSGPGRSADPREK